jgi:hypothetical protein
MSMLGTFSEVLVLVVLVVVVVGLAVDDDELVALAAVVADCDFEPPQPASANATQSGVHGLLLFDWDIEGPRPTRHPLGLDMRNTTLADRPWRRQVNPADCF